MEDKDLYYDASFMKKVVEENPMMIRFYQNTVSLEDYNKSHYTGVGTNLEKNAIIYSVYQEAFEHGFVMDIELFEMYPELCFNSVFFLYLMRINPENSFYVQFYEGFDVEVYQEAVRFGYQMYKEEIMRFASDADSMKKIVSFYPEAVGYYQNMASKSDFFRFSLDHEFDYPGYEEQKKKIMGVYQEAFEHGLVLDDSFFMEHEEFGMNDILMYLALDVDLHFIKYYQGKDPSIYMKAIRMGYSIHANEIEKLDKCDEVFLLLIDKDPMWQQFLYYYRGKSVQVFEKAILNGYKVSLGDVINHKKDDDIFRLFIRQDIKWLSKYEGDNPKIFLEAMDLYKIDLSYEQIGKFRDSYPIMKEFIKRDPMYSIYYTGEKRDEVLDSVHLPRSFPSEAIPFYQGNARQLYEHYQDLVSFLNRCLIPEEDFHQYMMGNLDDWLSSILIIISSEEKYEQFIQFMNVMNQNYYSKNSNKVLRIEQFHQMIMNYVRYPELCMSIIEKENLTKSDKETIDWLFLQEEELEEEWKPKRIDELDLLYDNLKKTYQREVDYTDIISIKDTICKMLFNKDVVTLENLLQVYGNTIEIKRLQFNDRTSSKVRGLCEEVVHYTSMIEDVLDCQNIQKLKKILKQLFEHFDYTMECSKVFRKYESKIRELYETDMQEMLTKSSTLDDGYDPLKSEKYGVAVYDFSNRPYIFLAHVKSFQESVQELIKGEVRDNHNFISLSAISYRNQVLFGNVNSLTFGYNVLPDDSFISSSRGNILSNGMIHSYDYQYQLDNTIRERGVLETSLASQGENSEILCYREGLKPFCIILPNGREPKDEEILLAQRYGLSFVVTQNLGKEISNPRMIEERDKEDYREDSSSSSISSIHDTWKDYQRGEEARRIAVFSDAHALFEPTLAILEDIRKKGITEIYSLGDNIGTGPNPREVMELLDDYHVQSIMGNHELYAVEGIQQFEKHLMDVGGYQEAEENSSYTRNQLTSGQIQNIKLFPAFKELIVGGEKILLIHSELDYNTNLPIMDTNPYTMVLKGHVHFADEKNRIRTLRSSSFGDGERSKDAYYLVLTEKDKSGFDVEVCRVSYNRKNLFQDLKESSLEEVEKNKIRNWL